MFRITGNKAFKRTKGASMNALLQAPPGNLDTWAERAEQARSAKSSVSVVLDRPSWSIAATDEKNHAGAQAIDATFKDKGKRKRQ